MISGLEKIEFDSAGFKEILCSGGVQGVVASVTAGIESKANAGAGGSGYESEVIMGNYGGGRWVGFVHSTDRESAEAEAEYKALSRAVG